MTRTKEILATFALAFSAAVFMAPSAAAITSLDGVLERRIIDDFASGRVEETFELVTDDGRRIALDFGPNRADAPAPGARIAVSGILQGGALTVAAALQLDGDFARSAGARTPLGARKVAVILFNFQNAPVEPWTTAEIRGALFTDVDSTSAYYEEQSGGSLHLTGKVDPDGDVFGWYTIPYATGVNCYSPVAYTEWAEAASAAAVADGKDLSGYDHIVYVWSPYHDCPFSGVGDLGGDEVWINGFTLEGVRLVAMHELGHNFGLYHSSTLNCLDAAGERVSISRDCRPEEYGDPFDIMGQLASTHLHTWHKRQLELLDFREYPVGTSRTMDGSGIFLLTIAPEEQPLPGTIQTVIVPGALTQATAFSPDYYVEFRQPFGFFEAFAPTDPVVNGVSIRVAPIAGYSYLLDATPETSTFLDAAVPVGRSFVDAGRCLIITTLAVAPTGADVRIALEPDGSHPTAPWPLYWEPLPPSGARLAWGFAEDDVEATSYHVFASSPSGDVEIGSNSSLFRLPLDGLTGDPVTYWVVAKDRCGNIGPRSNTVTFGLPSDPAIVLSSPAPATSVRLHRNLRVKATVNGGPITRIEMYLDGLLVKARDYRPRRAFRKVAWQVPVRRVPSGTHAVTLRAYNATGSSEAAFVVQTIP